MLDILENCFEWNRDRKLIRKIRKEVEDFERWTEMKAAEMQSPIFLKEGVAAPTIQKKIFYQLSNNELLHNLH